MSSDPANKGGATGPTPLVLCDGRRIVLGSWGSGESSPCAAPRDLVIGSGRLAGWPRMGVRSPKVESEELPCWILRSSASIPIW